MYFFSSDVLESADVLNIEISNYDLVTPDKDNSAGDQGTEYFEAEDDGDAEIIKIEDDSGEEDGPSTSTSASGTGRSPKRLKLRLETQHELNIS